MSSIPNSFKHNMIGGFRQADVMKYIKQIAKQRNEYRDRSDSMESTLDYIKKTVKADDTGK